MGFRLRKSLKIGKGVKFNQGLKRSSFSFGKKGFTLNLGKNGAKTTIGIPGTGLSYSFYKPFKAKQKSGDSTTENQTNVAGITIPNWIIFLAIAAIFIAINYLQN